MTVKFNRLVPFIQISHADTSIEFYCKLLGFEKQWVFQFNENSPSNVCVTRDIIKLYLTEFPESKAGTKYVFWIENFDDFIQELDDKKADYELRNENGDFGVREIRIHDPDNNMLVFAEGSGEDE